MASKKTVCLGGILVFSIFILIGVVLLTKSNSSGFVTSESPPELLGVIRPEPKMLEPFVFSDQFGRVFRKDNVMDKWTFMFFGYTQCPDVCPMTLSVLSQVYDRIDGADDAQVLFVSVDPDRDTPKVLKEYVGFFNDKFIALTGEKDNIDGFVEQIGAGYLLEEESSPGEYLVNHTSAIFLVDPRGRLVAAFSQPHDANTILEQFKNIRAYLEL